MIKRRKGRPNLYRVYHIFYEIRGRRQKKSLYAKNIDDAVARFKEETDYIPKFARDHWHKEVWTDYSNENSVQLEC